MLASYAHFLKVAARSQWDDAAIELSGDAARFSELSAKARRRIGSLVAGFGIGESAVERELGAFEARAGDPQIAACFALQRRDEARHARLFARLQDEVLGAEPLAHEGERLKARFSELFEGRLRRDVARLAGGEIELAEAVGLYHLLLEGCLFSAGQSALLAALDSEPGLPGMRQGVELIARDERWHIGFGVRLLRDASRGVELVEGLSADAGDVLAAWGDELTPAQRERALALHGRRLRAAGLSHRAAQAA